MSLAKLCNQLATIERPDEMPMRGPMGDHTVTWYTLLEDVPCMIQQLSAAEREVFGGEGLDVSHRCFMLLQSETLTEKNRLKVGTQIYEIHLVEDVAALGHHLELLLTEYHHG